MKGIHILDALAFLIAFENRVDDVPKKGSSRNAAVTKRSRKGNCEISGNGDRALNKRIRQEDHEASPMELARQLVLSSWREIVASLIQKSIEGGYQQTKLLLELSKLASSETGMNGKRNEQLCDALLEGWGLSPSRRSLPEAGPIAHDDRGKQSDNECRREEEFDANVE